jgi:hypothetical protein
VRKRIEPCFEKVGESKEDVTKTYRADYVKNGGENEYFEAEFEEMAQCFVNGRFAEVGFARHEFNIGRYLKDGKNEITLVVTGSAANKYSDKEIYYGLL